MESTGTGSRYPVVDMNMNGKSVLVPQFLVVLLYYPGTVVVDVVYIRCTCTRI